MSTTSVTRRLSVGGVLTDADAHPTVVVSYTGEPALANAVTHDGIGVYTCTVTDPAPALVYTFTWTFVYLTVSYTSTVAATGPGVSGDLITAARAIEEPPLAAIALTNPRLLSLITAASAGIQRYLGRWYTPAEIAAGLDADLVLATSLFVAYLWERTAKGAQADYAGEALGDYSYNLARGFEGGSAPSPRLEIIRALLAPFVVSTGPVLVLDANENTEWRNS